MKPPAISFTIDRLALPNLPLALVCEGDWRQKCIIACKGNQTLLGCITIAMMGKSPQNPPRLGTTAVIMEDGSFVADIEVPGQPPCAARLGSVDEVRDVLRRLADALKLDDTNRRAMFIAMHKWVIKDYRAQSH